MYSLTYTGVAVTVIGFLFKAAGVPFAQEDAEGTISFITQLVGVLVTLWGRYRAGGVNALGFKK